MAIAATASDSPLIQGRNARVNGQTKETCPYPEESDERIVWLQAWEEAGASVDSGAVDQDEGDPATKA